MIHDTLYALSCRYLFSVLTLNGTIAFVVYEHNQSPRAFRAAFEKKYFSTYQRHAIDYSLEWAPDGHDQIPEIPLSAMVNHYRMYHLASLKERDAQWKRTMAQVQCRSKEELNFHKRFYHAE